VNTRKRTQTIDPKFHVVETGGVRVGQSLTTSDERVGVWVSNFSAKGWVEEKGGERKFRLNHVKRFILTTFTELQKHKTA
jgi:hypothetical protein